MIHKSKKTPEERWSSSYRTSKLEAQHPSVIPDFEYFRFCCTCSNLLTREDEQKPACKGVVEGKCNHIFQGKPSHIDCKRCSVYQHDKRSDLPPGMEDLFKLGKRSRYNLEGYEIEAPRDRQPDRGSSASHHTEDRSRPSERGYSKPPASRHEYSRHEGASSKSSRPRAHAQPGPRDTSRSSTRDSSDTRRGGHETYDSGPGRGPESSYDTAGKSNRRGKAEKRPKLPSFHQQSDVSWYNKMLDDARRRAGDPTPKLKVKQVNIEVEVEEVDSDTPRGRSRNMNRRKKDTPPPGPPLAERTTTS